VLAPALKRLAVHAAREEDLAAALAALGEDPVEQVLDVDRDPIAHELLHDLKKLREEDMRRRLTRVLARVLPRERRRHLELLFLEPGALAPRVEVDRR